MIDWGTVGWALCVVELAVFVIAWAIRESGIKDLRAALKSEKFRNATKTFAPLNISAETIEWNKRALAAATIHADFVFTDDDVPIVPK